jgi:hypothetical protein
MRRRARGNATLPSAGSKFSKNPPIVLPVYPAVSLVNSNGYGKSPCLIVKSSISGQFEKANC